MGRNRSALPTQKRGSWGKKGAFEYAYNVQISVESSHQIIVGEHVSQEANDKKEVKPAIEEIDHTLGERPDKMSMDNGYLSADNIEAVEEAQIDGYIATGREGQRREEIEKSQRKITKQDFVYEEEADQYRCPEGKTLALKSVGADGSKVYQAKASDCQSCPLGSRCTRSDQGRRLSVDAGEPARRRMKEKMQAPESKEVYSRRKTIVEPVYGVIKSVIGFGRFSLRGIKKVSGEWSLVCGAYNIKKLVHAMIRGDVCPDPTNPGVQGALWGVNVSRVLAFFAVWLPVLRGKAFLASLGPSRPRSAALSY
jgi:transposase